MEKKICLHSKTPIITSRRKVRNRKSPFGRPHGDVPGGSGGEECACNAGDLSLIPGSGGSPGEGHGNPLQYSRLENPMDRGAWRAPWGHKDWDMTESSVRHAAVCGGAWEVSPPMEMSDLSIKSQLINIGGENEE